MSLNLVSEKEKVQDDCLPIAPPGALTEQSSSEHARCRRGAGGTPAAGPRPGPALSFLIQGSSHFV